MRSRRCRRRALQPCGPIWSQEAWLEKAISYLEELLTNGDVTAQEGLEGAEANGIATRTLDRARKIVGVVAKKEEGVFNGSWFWTKNAKKTANL